MVLKVEQSFGWGELAPTPDHFVEEGEFKVSPSFLQGWELEFIPFTRDEALVPGYVVPCDKAYCTSLYTLKPVYVLLQIRIPGCGTIFKNGSHKCSISCSLDVNRKEVKISTKEGQYPVCLLGCLGNMLFPLEVLRNSDAKVPGFLHMLKNMAVYLIEIG